MHITQTKYTMAANPPPGYLCHQCAKASGVDPFKKPAIPRKRKAAAEKRELISYEERRFPSLASLCIEVFLLQVLPDTFSQSYSRAADWETY
jgi:DNA repair protein RAD7